MKWILFLAIAAPASIVATIILYIVVSNSNHSAIDIRYAIPMAAAFLVVSVAGVRKSPRMAIFAIAVNLFAMAFVYSADTFNVLVHYEEWIDRGMPDSPLIE